MEENSAHWLAIREAARRLLVETDLVIAVPPSSIKVWHRLILNMGDSMPQRLNFPELIEGQFSVRKEDTHLFDFSLDEPREKTTLWLPFDTDELMHESNASINESICNSKKVIDDSSGYTDELTNGVHESIKESMYE